MFPFQLRRAAQQRDEQQTKQTSYQTLLAKLARERDLQDDDAEQLVTLAQELGRNVDADVAGFDEAARLSVQAATIDRLRQERQKLNEEARAFDRASADIEQDRKRESRRRWAAAGAATSALDSAEDARRKLETLRRQRPDLPGFEWSPTESFLLDGDERQRIIDHYDQKRRAVILRHPARNASEMAPAGQEAIARIEAELAEELRRLDTLHNVATSSSKKVTLVREASISAIAGELLAKYRFVPLPGQPIGQFNQLMARVQRAGKLVRNPLA